MSMSNKPILVIGGTGKTGRRVIDRLDRLGVPTRNGSRTAPVPFDWENPQTWAAAVANTSAVYLTYYPDLALPGAVDAVRAVARMAVEGGTERLVLLSGRGEPEAQAAEIALAEACGAGETDWTVVRAAWFAQNFSESFLLEAVQSGSVVLPVDPKVREPFIDAEDIADVVVAALTEPGHAGRIYEVTGPRLLSIGEMVEEIAQASRRDIRFQTVPADAYARELAGAGVPEDLAEMVLYLFGTIMDGRNEILADGVQQALGRPPRDLSDYIGRTAESGVWRIPERASA